VNTDPKSAGADYVPEWMAALGLTKDRGWLTMSKDQLRTMQRPERPLKVRVWATGMLHTASYKGEDAKTMRKGSPNPVPLTPADIITELQIASREYYQEAGIRLMPADISRLRETKENLRRALDGLEDEGIAMRFDAAGVPLRNLSVDQRRRLSGGQTRMKFWLVPRKPNPDTVAAEWERINSEENGPNTGSSEVVKKCLPLNAIAQILNALNLGKIEKAKIEDPKYRGKIEAWMVAAGELWKQMDIGAESGPEVGAESGPEVGAESGPEVGAESGPEVGAESRTLKNNREINVESIAGRSVVPPSLNSESHQTASVSSPEPTDRPITDLRIKTFLADTFPGINFPIESEVLERIGATIRNESNWEQFKAATLKNGPKARGWKYFVRVAESCVPNQATYERSFAAGAGMSHAPSGPRPATAEEIAAYNAEQIAKGKKPWKPR
jgi:hypothetical protein